MAFDGMFRALRSSVRSLLLLGTLACGAGAQASVVWTLNNFTFSDGGSASGSFTWDEVNNAATSWNIITTAGSQMSGHTYSSATGLFAANDTFDLLFFTDGPLQFRVGLTDLNDLDTPVAALNLFSQIQGQTGNEGYLECDNCSPYRAGNAGAYLSADVVTIPEPTTLMLVGLACFGLVGTSRARRA